MMTRDLERGHETQAPDLQLGRGHRHGWIGRAQRERGAGAIETPGQSQRHAGTTQRGPAGAIGPWEDDEHHHELGAAQSVRTRPLHRERERSQIAKLRPLPTTGPVRGALRSVDGAGATGGWLPSWPGFDGHVGQRQSHAGAGLGISARRAGRLWGLPVELARSHRRSGFLWQR